MKGKKVKSQRPTEFKFNKNSLKYLVTSAVGGLTAAYYSALIHGAIGSQVPYKTYWGTLGTDYFGIIGQIALSQFALTIFGSGGLEKIVNYVIPAAFAGFHTILESLALVGVQTPNTSGGFDPLDVACYWGGAATMMILSKIYERKKNKTYTKK